MKTGAVWSEDGEEKEEDDECLFEHEENVEEYEN